MLMVELLVMFGWTLGAVCLFMLLLVSEGLAFNNKEVA